MNDVRIYKVPDGEPMTERQIQRIIDRLDAKEDKDRERFGDISERITRVETILSNQSDMNDRIRKLEKYIWRMAVPGSILIMVVTAMIIATIFGVSPSEAL